MDMRPHLCKEQAKGFLRVRNALTVIDVGADALSAVSTAMTVMTLVSPRTSSTSALVVPTTTACNCPLT
jgi:hypothetical protein